MQKRIMTIAAVAGLLAALAAADVFAASTTVVRPAGSQRRDGTFLTTGKTANGSTVRPNGLATGTCVLTTPTATTTAK